jgi:hypothetical protein
MQAIHCFQGGWWVSGQAHSRSELKRLPQRLADFVPSMLHGFAPSTFQNHLALASESVPERRSRSPFPFPRCQALPARSRGLNPVPHIFPVPARLPHDMTKVTQASNS